ncbi:MAG TPA: DUF721 domain-containing protein [Tenuifilaceae bacterium]|nr:DUF721 domain-containing protein [Tenuifilaceae bacterium]
MGVRKSSVVSLGDAIKEFIKEHKLDDKFLERRIAEAWQSMLGSQIGELTREVQFAGGVLTISLTSSVLRKELSMSADKVVTALNTHLGANVITKLVLT